MSGSMKHRGHYLVISIVVCALSLAATLYLPPLVIGMFKDASSYRGHLLEVVVSIFVLALGFGLYAVREKHRHLYGVAEISFGVTTASFTASKLRTDISPTDVLLADPSNFVPWLAILACVYVVVRGVENMIKGAEELNDHGEIPDEEKEA
jgi:uncharacterized membrane protein YbhN (UPF0104 family)